MTIQAISAVKPQNKKNHTGLALTAGAAIGAAARYVVPNKKEVADGFFSSARMNARGSERSILKYGALGACVALGLNCLKNVFSKNDEKTPHTTVYSELLNSPDYAYEITWLG